MRTQPDPRGGRQGEQRIQRRRCGGLCGGSAQQPGGNRAGDIEDRIADRHTSARCAAGRAEHTMRQVLDGEAVMALGRFDPGAQAGIVRRVNHGANFFPSPSQRAS